MKNFLRWEEQYAKTLMEKEHIEDTYYTHLHHIPPNSFRVVYLPDRWRLPIEVIQKEIETGIIPVIFGWLNQGTLPSGEPRLCRMLYVSHDFLSRRETERPQLEQNASQWEDLKKRREHFRRCCEDAATFYSSLPPSLSPELHLPRVQNCPVVRQARKRAQTVKLSAPANKKAAVLKALPSDNEAKETAWIDSVTATCRAVLEVVKEGRKDWVSGQEPGSGDTDSAGKETFRALLTRMHPQGTRPRVKAESAAWEVIAGLGYTHSGGRKPNP